MWENKQQPGCCKETARCSVLFPTPNDSLIVICFKLQNVRAVILLAGLKADWTRWN